jgi:hypothetical protein
VKIVVFRGRETRGGRPVLLHQLTAPNDHTGVLTRALQYLVKNPASAGGRILDLVEMQGAHFLVTMDQPECLALLEWLDWELEEAKPAPPVSLMPPAAATMAPEAANREPGEFTRLFERQGQSQRTESLQPAMPSAPVAPPQMVPASQPGEFTRLFRNPLSPPSEASREPLPVGSPSQNAPGEFTRIFGGGGAPPGTGTPAAPVPPLQSLTESLEPRQTPSRTPVAAPTVPAAPAAPGEFTRVIGGSASAAPHAPPAMAPALTAPPPPAPLPIAMPTAPSAPPMPATPQMPVASFPVAVPMAPAVAPVAPAASPAPQKASGPPMAIVILFGILLVAAFALILFVLLRR